MPDPAPARLRDPGLYDYVPLPERPRITWPGGARIAVWLVPNIEFYELDPPPNPTRAPWPRPAPDVLNYSVRDYGNRVGLWRMIEVMERHGIRGSVSLNVAVCDHFSDIVRDCAALGWEFLGHGVYNTRYLYGLDRDQERAVLPDTRDRIEQHTGQRADGFLAPALTSTPNTMALLAEEGFRYTMDLFHDDQPTPLRTASGPLLSVPYSWEINDAATFSLWNMPPGEYGDMIKRQFDQLYLEGAEGGTVLGWPLHPFRLGQPNRIRMFAEVVRHMAGHDGVWFATGREIADWYGRHYLSAAPHSAESAG